MAKKAILEVLENTIGQYVLNLDAESLNVAIWSGKIELQSLQLDIAAVNSELAQRAHDAPNLASPFRVTEGRFEKVQLDVPWTNLSSKPVIFRAKGLYVWMEPHDFLKDDTYGKGPVPPGNRGGEGKESSPKKNQSKAEKERMDSIARAETARKSANAVRMAWEEKVDYSIDGDSIAQESSSSQNSSFLSRLVRRIIENLQLEIEDVHLAVRGCECAAGVVLRSLFLATTDAKGNRTFVDRQANPNDSASSFLHKELSISGLGIYLQKGQEAGTNGKKEYLLSPLSFQATLRQSDLDQCLDFPKYLVHSKLQSLNITLSRTQLELGNRLALVVAPNTKPRPLFPEYRPLGTVSGNAKQWWRYAVRCIGRLNRRRSWVEFLTAFHKRKVYLELYKRHTCSEKAAWLKRLNDSELLELKKIESDRSISIAGLMLWRSIADAQVTKEREKQKHAESNKQHDTSKGDPSAKKKSVLSSIFGGAQRKDTSDSMHGKLDNEDATPIMLTVNEMKELEELALEHPDHVLTKDSIYCDINFVLGSFQVNLTTSLHEPITSLEMGMVSTTFKANADGSFKFGLSLLSLEISDNVTSGTFYPTICCGVSRTNLKTAHAFQFELKKSEKGDQELTLKMVAFEIIASPLLVFAVKEFFDVSDANMSSPSNLQLDVNASSLINGSVSTIDDNVSDTFSSAIMDAWNGKNKKKQMWTMDCDVSAPILILPENCTDPSATVLICNFGRFNFKYDTEALSPAVLKWFDAHQCPDNLDSDVDHVKLEMSDLSFIISSVGEATKKGIGGLNLDVSNSVIQPVSFALDIGIEHASPSLEDSPRMCAIGVLPAIILRLEPSYVEKVLRVAAQWTSNLHNLKGDTPATEEDEILKTLPKSFEPKSLSSGTSLSNSQADTSSMEYMHISVSLLRLSINIYSDKGDGLEVHLVSLVASSSLDTDGSSSNRVRMGWFWILDRLEPDSKFPRCQRLLFHSKLPRPAIDYAKNDQYDAIMEDLAKQGAFKPNYTGSTDLADISILQLPATKAVKYHSQVKEFPREYIQAIQVDHATVIDAKFTSIFINWNPKSVASFFEAKAKLLEFKDTASLTYEQITTLQSQEGRMNAVVPQSEKMPPAVVGVHSFFILAQMETFEMSLNSAKDDLPLFTLAMSDSKVNQHTFEGDDDNSFLSFALGDFRIETPSFGSTLESYRTILGVAPSTTSLLTVKYCKGAHSVSLCDVKDLDKSKCEACAEIALSPMRYVHIHSQVFTLKDYVTDGVFGVLAAKAASSAAAAAMEVAKSSQSGEQLFYVVASGFDIVLPQAAYSDKYFLLHTGKLEAHYRTLENNVGSESCMSMTDLMMYSGQQMNMFSSPVNMDFIVKMKSPFTIGTEDERATTVDMTTSRIRILLAKSDYAQMIHTLDCNISEQNNFLRIKKSQLSRSSSMGNENGNDSLVKSALVSGTKDSSQVGKEDAETSQRMYINFNFQEISLDLCGTTTDDPILSLAALKALVVVKLFPDKKQTKASVTLHDLACDDRRAGSLDMSFRRMIGRTHANLSDANHIKNSDVFSLDYTSNVGDSQDIKVNIGSYQIVVLPDVISDMVNFTKIPSHHGQLSTGDSSTDDSAMQVAVTNNASQEYEARLQTLDAGNASAQKKTSYHVQSSNVQLVFVDLGSSSATSSQTAKQSAITEVIVLQGKMKANFEMTSDELGEGVIENDYMLDAERVEIYTAKGAKLYHPVQILEPATFSIHCFQRLGDTVGAESTDLKFVTLTPIDVTISMQNAALASTLVTSISDSFAGNDTVLEDNSEFHSLSTNEASRIAMLSSSLEYVDALDSPNQYPSEHPKDISIHDGDTLQKTKRVMKLRATLPSATLTLINDFQGMDEALFKLKTADCVLGGELDYASVSELEKPCFGCSMNTRQVERAMFQRCFDYAN